MTYEGREYPEKDLVRKIDSNEYRLCKRKEKKATDEKEVENLLQNIRHDEVIS